MLVDPVFGAFALAVVAFIVDIISRRGYGLVVLVVAGIGVSVWLLWLLQQAEIAEAARAAQLGAGQLVDEGRFVGLFTAGYLSLTHIFVGVPAVMLASMANQWRWFTGILIGLLFPGYMDWNGPSFIWPSINDALFIIPFAILICAALSPGLAYGIWRVGHPITKATA